MGQRFNLFDTVTGRLDYTCNVSPHFGAPLVEDATDFDLNDEFTWSSYTVEQYSAHVLKVIGRVSATMDDGSSLVANYGYIYGQFRPLPILSSVTTTTRDSLGRVDQVVEVQQPQVEACVFDIVLKLQDFDAATGMLVYSFTRHRDEHTEAMDFDAVTGVRNYGVTSDLGGRILAQDYNAGTGLLDYVVLSDPDGHILTQDHDAAGRPDYEVERWADGRMVVTDHDLADAHPWTSYSIAYSTTGAIADITVT